MVESSQNAGKPGGGPDRTPHSMPMAALAGAVVLIALVGFALYRRHATSP